jgi:iduronate 2-sulfatase
MRYESNYIFQGTSSDALVSLVDIYPTLMDLTGLQAGSVTEGKSLWPILQGKTEAVRDYVEIETEEANAIRTKRYKYLQSRDGVVEELYDLENDPFELKNIATDPASQQILKEHRKLYEEIFSMTPGI